MKPKHRKVLTKEQRQLTREHRRAAVRSSGLPGKADRNEKSTIRICGQNLNVYDSNNVSYWGIVTDEREIKDASKGYRQDEFQRILAHSRHVCYSSVLLVLDEYALTITANNPSEFHDRTNQEDEKGGASSRPYFEDPLNDFTITEITGETPRHRVWSKGVAKTTNGSEIPVRYQLDKLLQEQKWTVENKKSQARTAKLIEAIGKNRAASRPVRKQQKPDARKPVVKFSDKFLTVYCESWPTSERRKRIRQAPRIWRELFENWKKGNKPMLVDDLVKKTFTDRLDKVMSSTEYPRQWELIIIEANEKTGKRTVKLSEEYKYIAI